MAEENRITKEASEMILIPSGEFLMGRDGTYWEEKPVHKVAVRSFYMDKTLVTNGNYKRFCDKTDKPYPPNPNWEDMPNYFLDYPDYPVVNVSWLQACEYARWVGKRLPTEEEWEYAAGGSKKQAQFPWGNEEPDGGKANYADRNTDYPWRDFKINTGYKYTSPVGSYPPNEFGLYDMAGNV
jgi:sulfatase modifying factor 1